MQDKRRIQADLEWLFSSPDFLSVEAINRLHQQNLINGSELLRQAKPDSQSFSFQSTHRLGVYFEQLWHHLIRSNSSLELKRHNAQVIIDKQTLGEFDSIIKSENSGQVVHCELAVKFYLQIGSGSCMADWVGPNLRDRFDRKFLRLLNHQLALSNKPLVKSWLSQQAIHVDQCGLMTKGRLYYQLSQFSERQFCFPPEVNPQHLKGFWMTHQAFQQYQEQTNFVWFELPRMYWLSELTEFDYSRVHAIEKLNPEQLAMVVAMRDDKEVMRGFVVTEEWLQKARARITTNH